MFSYVFMKILEMRPRSYDRRMDMVSRGRVRAVKEAFARRISPGSHVLEIGCGTGELAGLLIERTCTVEGFDLSPSMVEAARARIEDQALEGKFTVKEMGIEGMDVMQGDSFDAVVSTLVFSELTGDERHYALEHAFRVLKTGGTILLADEVVPKTAVRRLLHAIVRIPVSAVTYLVANRSTQPLADLTGELTHAGFHVEWEERSHGGAFAMVTGRKE